MADVASVIGPLALSATMNAITEVRSGRPGGALKVAFANVALFAGLTAVGEYIDWELAATLAVLNLMYTFLTDGKPVIEWFAKLVGGTGQPVTATNKTTGNAARAV
jgi:hypothetical protein